MRSRPRPAEAGRMHSLDLETRTSRWAGIAGRSHGDLAAPRRPLVFLHGLTFDHRMWDPVLAALPAGHPAIALPLPRPGAPPGLPPPRRDDVPDPTPPAVAAAGLREPVLVGH